ncbi:hypothetical protein FIU86_05715 [Roseovarius sp. THAF9]|uniref:DUF3280 domain-containing protein n=1 Tax=Roseovarius sp. THAF9 TaxID=2587847 RepID=UPI001267FD49|nr:DUF3280 domain-containing protein [Roseovarius sp. THAF9]QFT92330.1 hypothetical protein FIU86_05715 [Roseovarius sp. THAF9]
MRLILFLFLAFAPAAYAQGDVAFFGLHLEDSSDQTTQSSSLMAEGPDEADLARVKMLEGMLAERFEAEGYTLLDLAPVAEELERVSNPASCYGCDIRMAETLGAEFILVGEVNMVSPVLVSIAVQLKDAASGEIVKGGSVSVRGSTDEIWARGMRQILKNRIFREEDI